MTVEELASLHARAMTVPAPWSTNDFQELIAQNGTFLVPLSTPVHGSISKAAHTLAGFVLGRVVLDEAELLTLAVDPDAQRQGIGRACLAAFEAEATARGAVLLHLEVAESNAPAIALYNSAGWQEAGRRKAYYKGKTARIDAILMTKRLNAD